MHVPLNVLGMWCILAYRNSKILFLHRDTSHQESDTNLYSFNMGALMDHLKSQGEQNKSASYFNIDILKYQVMPDKYSMVCEGSQKFVPL